MVGHTDELSGHDPVQVKLMEEECILVDADDKVLGHDSKKSCMVSPLVLLASFSSPDTLVGGQAKVLKVFFVSLSLYI